VFFPFGFANVAKKSFSPRGSLKNFYFFFQTKKAASRPPLLTNSFSNLTGRFGFVLTNLAAQCIHGLVSRFFETFALFLGEELSSWHQQFYLGYLIFLLGTFIKPQIHLARNDVVEQ
jgi:hypothetical protein